MDSDLQVVVVHGDLLDEFVEQDSLFGLGGFVPDAVEIEFVEQGGELVEALGDVVVEFDRGLLLFEFGPGRVDQRREACLFFAELLGAEEFVVVEAQQLAPLLEQVVQCVRREWFRAPAGWRRPGAPVQFLADRILERRVSGDEPQPEESCTHETGRGTAGEGAAGAPVSATVTAEPGPGNVERHETFALAAADSAGHEVLALASTLRASPVGCCELLGRDERLVRTRVPLAVEDDLAEVDPFVEDPSGGRVVDAGGGGDVALAGPFAPKGEDAPHDRSVVVRDEVPVDEVVPGGRAVHPPALACSLGHAHPDVLGELLPVELSERTEDVVEHPPRCRGQVDPLRERVQCDAVLAELVGEQDEVLQVPREPVESPGEHVGDVSVLDHGEQPLQAGSVEVLAGQARVGDDHDLAQVMKFGVGLQLLRLASDREPLRRLLLR